MGDNSGDMIRCPHCKVPRSPSEFAPSRPSECRFCANERKQRWRKENHKHELEVQRQRRANHQQRLAV